MNDSASLLQQFRSQVFILYHQQATNYLKPDSTDVCLLLYLVNVAYCHTNLEDRRNKQMDRKLEMTYDAPKNVEKHFDQTLHVWVASDMEKIQYICIVPNDLCYNLN